MFKTVDRLMVFIKHIGLSARQFDLSIGASNGYTLRMKKNSASIGSDVIEEIMRIYPQLNLIWLITGEGEMLKPDRSIIETGELPQTEQIRLERLIENKIKERHEKELKELLEEVTKEINDRAKQ
ncbi:hypothetical protein [Croceitalea vernalis]|uniref:HTH cro/C1-type domain-containing protein n=1 Tax=Croceitalea vernalis TaxID=3075599 RepID=A0ABU3BGZ6_9FLAO|nr:hypothetical protein [Croceitalea sp. P007]MDT0621427.1 hypothetical protein [Croceitalea sp. P007]